MIIWLSSCSKRSASLPRGSHRFRFLFKDQRTHQNASLSQTKKKKSYTKDQAQNQTHLSKNNVQLNCLAVILIFVLLFSLSSTQSKIQNKNSKIPYARSQSFPISKKNKIKIFKLVCQFWHFKTLSKCVSLWKKKAYNRSSLNLTICSSSQFHWLAKFSAFFLFSLAPSLRISGDRCRVVCACVCPCFYTLIDDNEESIHLLWGIESERTKEREREMKSRKQWNLFYRFYFY